MPTKPKVPPETIAAVKIGAEMSASQFRGPYHPPLTIEDAPAVAFTAPQLIAVLAVAAERGWSACMRHLRGTRGRKAHPLCVAPKPCVCADCSMRTALAHAAADAKCGRRWTCQCAACKVVSELPEFHRTPVVPER